MNNLAVIIPFFNEENYLKDSIERVLKLNIFHQILIVDDCSTDNSTKIALDLSSSNEAITYLQTSMNGGKGNALIAARDALITTHVVIHDADLEYFPEDIIDMYKNISENEDTLILGSRFIGNKERKNIYRRTLFANKAMSLFFSLVNGYKVTDVATCYK